MNTKGIKFLAVLAVMAMAFAAVLVLAPADKATAITFVDGQVDPIEVTTSTTTSGTGYDAFYISDDASVKVKSLARNVTFYVQNGKELTLDIRANLTNTITIKSVTSDLEQKVTSANTSAVYETEQKGKLIIADTDLTFTGLKGQTVTYKALMPKTVKTTYDTGSFTTKVDTGYNYAIISSDATLGAAVIGKKVTVASGQYIEVTNASGVEMTSYGIVITDVDDSATTTTYYATGASASTFTMDNADDEVTVLNGTITVKNGSANVKASDVTMSGFTITNAGDDTIGLSGSIYDGSAIVAGATSVSGLTLDEYATLTIANNTTIAASSTVTDNGLLVLKNADATNLTVTGTGVVKADNIKLWTYSEAADPELKVTAGSFTGQFDVSAITEVAEVKDRFATASIDRNQTFVVVSDTVVTTALTIKGIVIINPGVTLTISKISDIGANVTVTGQYAQLINNGEIVIKTTLSEAQASASTIVGLNAVGGAVINDGRISASSDSKVNTTFTVNIEKGYGFENNGTITTAKNDGMLFTNGFTNNGEMIINGSFTGASTINNAGIFTLNNSEVKDNMIVEMSAGAVFDVKGAILGASRTITVSDGSSSVAVASGAFTGDGATITVRGITVKDVTTLTSTSPILDLSGTMGVSKSATVAGQYYPTLTTSGNVNVSDVLTIPENYIISLGSKTTVSGIATIAKKATDVTGTDSLSGLKLTVTGLVTCVEGDRLAACTNYAAAKFSYTNGTTIYTTLNDAVELADESDIASIEIGFISGSSPTYVTVTEDLLVPAGMSITGEHIVIGNAKKVPTVALASTAGFNIDDINLVNGMIIAENMNDIDDSAVKADVRVEDDESFAVTYMSIGAAIQLATPGSVIELNRDVVITDMTVTVPEGVTIDAIANDGHDFVMINSNLIVNGTLKVDDFYFVATTDDDIFIIVNGEIVDKHEDGDCIANHWYTPIGVSYHMTVTDEYGNEETYYVITCLENLQPAINVADDAKVTVEGDAKLGDLTISGREDTSAEVTFNGNISAGTVTLDDTTVIAKQGKKINATFADPLGSITIRGAYVKSNEMSIYSMDDAGVYMTGAITDDVRGTYSIVFTGITGIDGASSGATIGWGNYVDDEGDAIAYPSIQFNGTTLATGKKVMIQNVVEDDADRTNAGLVTINGSLIADNGTKLTIVADTEVLGALMALEKTEDASPGTIEVNAHLFVGALKSEIYDADAAIAAYNKHYEEYYDEADYGQQVSAAASLSGKIVVGEQYFITVLAGSDIEESIVEDLESMDIIIEDAVWITVYGDAGTAYSMDGLRAPIVNAMVDSITDIDGNVVAYFDHDLKVIYGCPALPLTQFDMIYIALDYDVFTVEIKTDGSVKAVYIDGILMRTGQNANIFKLENVATGTHKVTVEAATGYDAAKCVLYTEFGTILPGMAFTFTEFDCGDDYTVTYNINGTEIQPEPVPPTPEEESQWTITTILLVILVVLIAIMAVIVALRLNRS